MKLTHPERKKGKHFKGMPDHRRKPDHRTGDDIFDMVKDLEVIFGKGPGGQSVPNNGTGRTLAPRWAPVWMAERSGGFVEGDTLA